MNSNGSAILRPSKLRCSTFFIFYDLTFFKFLFPQFPDVSRDLKLPLLAVVGKRVTNVMKL